MIKLIHGIDPDDCIVFGYSDGWLDCFTISDLEDSVVIDTDAIPALIKELKKLKKKMDDES